MTRLLASVRSIPEARQALAGGADILDLKEPSTGALGAVPLALSAAVVRLVAGRVPVSATIGDLPMEPHTLARAVTARAATGVTFVKIGFFDTPLFQPCLEAIQGAPRGEARLVAVLFADRRPPVHRLDAIAATGFSGVMLDTCGKRAGGLRVHATDDTLADFLAEARRLGLFAGLAGSLGVSDIGPLLALRPDYLGFRGALCAGGARDSALDPAALAAVREQIPRLEPALI
jgi:uncharacterized protein (UPF0264 family)